jgi:hypothetical protein
MTYANAAGQTLPTTSDERAISRSMTVLASSLGDLETAARALLERVSPMIPGGSPFNHEQATKLAGGVTSAPQPVRSDFCAALDSRIYQIREITERLNEAARTVEV